MLFVMTVLLSVFSYLLGAVPNGLLLARTKGIDIREVGSGNTGATNVFRCVSKPLGVATFVLDFLKGFLPTVFFPLLVVRMEPMCCSLIGIKLLFGTYAILGHNWPVYLHFKGGKGVATTAGVLLAVAPLSMAVGVVTWLIAALATRYVSVASISAAVVVPLSAWLSYIGDDYLIRPLVLTALGGIVVWRHKSNIVRLRAGCENRFSVGVAGVRSVAKGERQTEGIGGQEVGHS